ncbi:MAG: UDP-N-acetylglucosamine 2-epimerase (non-hydrolyzing) [Acetobacterales bacterium]
MSISPILCVAGARPNMMKVAPVIAALRRTDARPVRLVHTGQHYDEGMNAVFFRDLGIDPPDDALAVGSASHAQMTARIMERFEPLVERDRPALVVVVGDVNSTIACALVSTKLGVPVAHVESGLRSFDRAMPEEINRVLTDQISDLLFVSEPSGVANLAREGVDAARVHLVGNVMIDSLQANLARAAAPATTVARGGGRDAAGRIGEGFALLTLHRPSNVDDQATLTGLLDVVADIAAALPVVFPVHPRTRARIESFGLVQRLEEPGLVALPPVGYLEMLGLMRDARIVLTDSGGIQEETTALGVPCLTLRANTERPVTVDQGTNTLVGSDPERIRAAFADIRRTGGKAGRVPELWDGRASERIAAIVRDRLSDRP